MISIERRGGRPLRIGHRGAATLAPENTLSSFRAAVEVGVDLVEFDVLARPSGELVVSHSHAEMVPETPTLDDALRFFVEEAPDTGVHLDLKLTRREPDVVAAVRRHGLAGRTFVSSAYLATARAIADADGDIRTGITIPRSVLGVSDAGPGASAARIGLGALRRIAPSRGTSAARVYASERGRHTPFGHHERVRSRGSREGRGRGRVDGRPPR